MRAAASTYYYISIDTPPIFSNLVLHNTVRHDQTPWQVGHLYTLISETKTVLYESLQTPG